MLTNVSKRVDSVNILILLTRLFAARSRTRTWSCYACTFIGALLTRLSGVCAHFCLCVSLRAAFLFNGLHPPFAGIFAASTPRAAAFAVWWTCFIAFFFSLFSYLYCLCCRYPA